MTSAPIHVPIVYVAEKIGWQYHQLVRDLGKEAPPTEQELNGLGADGWELAGAFTRENTLYLYFKRPAK